jgi:TonB-dependent SusC/RagA subfamily outer membrane receptor
VSVVVKGTSNGVTTDMNGKYSLNAPADASLQFSFAGMPAREIAVENRQVIDVGMDTGIQSTDTVTMESIRNLRMGDDVPLYVVDGKEVSSADLDNIPPQSIESINILKDQAAVTLYGEKAKNGIVTITTRK